MYFVFFIKITFFNWVSTFANNCGNAFHLFHMNIIKILERAMKNTKGTQYFSINFGNLRFLEMHLVNIMVLGFAKFAIEYSTYVYM